MASDEGLFPSTLATLERTPGVLQALLDGMPGEAVEAPSDEGWSAHDVVAHLLTIHYAGYVERVRIILGGDNPPVPNVDEEKVLEESGYRARSVSDLLDEFTSARAESMAWVRSLGPADFARTGQHQVAGAISVSNVLHHIAYHDLLHISQIARLLYAPVEARRGAMRSGFPDQ